jgi:hypothetical protein
MSNRQTLRKAIAGILKQTSTATVPSKQKDLSNTAQPKRNGESA